MKRSCVRIAGLGSALPQGRLSQDDAAQAAHQLRLFDEPAVADRQLNLLSALYRRSGVKTRHSVLLNGGDGSALDRQTFYELAAHRLDRGPSTADRMARYQVEAPRLAALACRRALAASGLDISSIRHLVTVSCSGFSAPGYDLELFEQLELSASTSRTHVGFMGCHGALNGLRVAKALAHTDPSESVLVCAVELCTLHHQYTDDPQQIVANSLFADGAAAAVVQCTPQSADGSQRKEPSEANAREGTSLAGPGRWELVANGSCLIPGSADAMSWKIGDHGFTMTLSPQVPSVIKQHLKPWLEQWLGQHGVPLHQVATWAIHPGGPRIVSAAAGALGLDEVALATSLGVLADCGNMSSPTILFILERLLAEQASGPCVALAFGPGLVVEAALLR